ncbi:MAG: hypothetical protein H8E48_08015 [Chloroflexi bacterium]|nr:hypothetical protein [Chloroflexota bacterium]
MINPPPILEFNPVGIWLDHFVSPNESYSELYRRFHTGGGTGVIFRDDANDTDSMAKEIALVKEVGLQAMVVVAFWDLVTAANSEEGAEALGRMLESIDGVVVTFSSGDPEELDEQLSATLANFQDKQAGFEIQLPVKPWLALVSAQTELPDNLPTAYSGRLLGFMLDREQELRSLFPSHSEVEESLKYWKQKLQGIPPVLFAIPLLNPQTSENIEESFTALAESLKEIEINALVIDSVQYERLPALQSGIEKLASFPDRSPTLDGDQQILGSHEGIAWCLALAPNNRVISGGEDRRLMSWSMDEGEGLELISDNASTIYSVEVLLDGRVVFGCRDGEIAIVNPLLPGRKEVLGNLDSPVIKLVVTPDGRRVISGSNDGKLCVWNTSGGRQGKLLGSDATGGHSPIKLGRRFSKKALYPSR